MAFVETADDLTIFFADGDSATIDGETVKGHFENEHDPVNAGGMVEFSIQSATFTCKTSDVTGIARVLRSIILECSSLVMMFAAIVPEASTLPLIKR